MSKLTDYVLTHTDRGECTCGQCMDKGNKPDPDGHTVDLGFFKVAPNDNPDKETFVRLTQEHHGEWNYDCNPLDGEEHSYLELGGWVGDQGIAMQYMGLGVLLGVFELLSPAMLGLAPDHPLFKQMLGVGFLSVKAVPQPVAA